MRFGSSLGRRVFRAMAILLMPAIVVAGFSYLSEWARGDSGQRSCQNRIVATGSFVDATYIRNRFANPTFSAETRELQEECERRAEVLMHRMKQSTAGQLRHVQSIALAPYIVAGDLEKSTLERILYERILPCAGALHLEYFDRRPHAPVTILLCSQEATYHRLTATLYGRSRGSIYGFYRPSTRTLVINLAAGEGTIIHELTHALIDFDCPNLPIWINEGIASLYEECRLVETPNGARLLPAVNWRLERLKQSIQDHSIRSTRELMLLESMVGDEQESLNYAHARYFCMYLNELGLLSEFYQLVRDNPAGAHGGKTALEQLFSQLSLYGLERDFQEWVLRLAEEHSRQQAVASGS